MTNMSGFSAFRSTILAIVGLVFTSCSAAHSASSPVESAQTNGVNGYLKCSREDDCEFVPLEENQRVSADGRISTVPELELDMRGTIHLRDESRVPPFVPAEWSRTPGAEAIDAAYPDDATGGAYGHLICSAGGEGRLENCEIDLTDPATRFFEKAFLDLAREFRLAKSTPPVSTIKFVSIDFLLRHNGDAPCWMGCIPIPPPPPPPPPPKKVE